MAKKNQSQPKEEPRKGEHINPFTVYSPEGLAASRVKDLFVDVFTDFKKIRNPGHTILMGARGSGKSMMFRYLQPDCQCLAENIGTPELDFFAIYVPIKSTQLNLTETARLHSRHAEFVLNEHFLSVVSSARTIETLKKLAEEGRLPADGTEELYSFARDQFLPLIEGAGGAGHGASSELERGGKDSVVAILASMLRCCESFNRQMVQYIKSLAFTAEAKPYAGPLFGYLDFLLPLLRIVKTLSFMPKGPYYLLIDDADNLSNAQTTVVNTWISTRTSSEVSIKASCQLRKYKTFRTVAGQTIDAPHDYQELNISDVYTSAKDLYPKRIEEIVAKRLRLARINKEPREFFPEDVKQEQRIRRIYDEFVERWPSSGRGARPGDDAYRYARPEYIRRLGGSKKSRSKYKYAGFIQLVHLSSGIVRFFLDAASQMFEQERKRLGEKEVPFIRTAVQDKVCREQAISFFENEFEKLTRETSRTKDGTNTAQKLRNLIGSMGETFHDVLVSDRSERRIFSIALTNIPDGEINDVLTLGVQCGYFHESTIGTKDGASRTRLYILSRRLAPYFVLDPTSFAGYLFVTNAALKDAMAGGKKLRKLASQAAEEQQITLF